MGEGGGNGHEPGQVDPEEFLRRLLAISSDDAAQARADAAHHGEVEDDVEVGKKKPGPRGTG